MELCFLFLFPFELTFPLKTILMDNWICCQIKMLLFSQIKIKPYAGKTKLVLKVWMEFKFTLSDLLAQFKAGLHFCDVTPLQRGWDLILVPPVQIQPLFTAPTAQHHQPRGTKPRPCPGQLWHGDAAQPWIPACSCLPKEAKYRNELWWKSHFGSAKSSEMKVFWQCRNVSLPLKKVKYANVIRLKCIVQFKTKLAEF